MTSGGWTLATHFRETCLSNNLNRFHERRRAGHTAFCVVDDAWPRDQNAVDFFVAWPFELPDKESEQVDDLDFSGRCIERRIENGNRENPRTERH